MALYDVTNRGRGDSVVSDSLCVRVSTSLVYKLALRVPKTLSWVSCPRDVNSACFSALSLVTTKETRWNTERGLKTPSKVCFKSCPHASVTYHIRKAYLIYLLHVIHSVYSVRPTPHVSALPTKMYLIQIRIRCLRVEYTLIIIQPTLSSRKLLKCGPFKDLHLIKDLLDIA